MKPMWEQREKTSLAISRVSWEQKSNVRGNSLGPLSGATLVEAERSHIRCTSTLNRVACRQLKFCLLQTYYQSIFPMSILGIQHGPLTTNQMCATSDQVCIITIISASLRKK
jgi:hypothetical protein